MSDPIGWGEGVYLSIELTGIHQVLTPCDHVLENPLKELVEYVRGNTMMDVAEWEAFPEGVLYAAIYVLCHTL